MSDGRYRAYPEYRASGIEWLAKVPLHWPFPNYIKFVSSLKGRLGWQGLKADEYRDEGPYVVSSAHFLDQSIQWEACPRVSAERYEMDANIQLAEEDILLMKDGAALGKLAFVRSLPGKACLNSHLLLFRPNSRAGEKMYEPRFLFYLFTTSLFQGYLSVTGTGATFLGVSQQAIGQYRLILPPLSEQTQIAKFLDHETAKIDRLIEKQEALIRLLKEKRQAVISHAVTKGLNPHAPLKDSGIEWLGQVPAHWDVKKLGYLCSVQTGGRDTEHAVEEGKFPFFVRSQTIERINSKSFDCEAVLTAGDGAGVGKVFHHYKGPFDFHQRVYMMNNFQGVSGRFFFHYFRELFYRVALEGGAKSTVDSLRRPMLTGFPFCVPPVSEQDAIIRSVEEKSALFDSLTTEAEQGISLLHERRTALISAAVTGKIDVRHWQPSEN